MSETKPCGTAGCLKPAICKGLCRAHYARYRRGELPGYTPPQGSRSYTYRTRRRGDGLCTFDGCGRFAQARGLCSAHAEQLRRGLPLTAIHVVSRAERGCKEPDCARPHEAHGYCGTHYTHAVGRAEVATQSRRAPTRNREGYVRVFVPGHPCAQKSGYALEHHVVMTAVLGRPILPGETVHHRNGVRDDNRPENLEVWVTRHGKGSRVEDVVAWAKEILARYEPSALA